DSAATVPQLLRGLVRDGSPRNHRGRGPVTVDARRRLNRLSRSEALSAVSDEIRGEVASVLGF
ncbi:hypothetical protein, partial [Streptomyces griseus]